MSRSLYSDLWLNDEQVHRVHNCVEQVDFHLPGATAQDFRVNRQARYLEYMFQAEDLESFGVGLQCTAPGMENQRTFIRLSRGQLLGEEHARQLPVNAPVLAAESMTLHRFYEQEDTPLRHGMDTYAADDGLPGAGMDLAMLETQLRDFAAFDQGAPVPGDHEILDLKVFWGTLLAGRYSHLVALRNRLSGAQEERLSKFETEANALVDVLHAHDLPTLETLRTTPVVDGERIFPTLLLRNSETCLL